MTAKQQSIFKGIPGAPGISIGPAYVYTREDQVAENYTPADVEGEVARFTEALGRAERDLRKIVAVTHEKLGSESAAIFEAQIMMLGDESLLVEVTNLISEKGLGADVAVRSVMSKHRRRLEASGSDYLRERSADLQDVQDRIIHHIQKRKFLSAIDSNSIVFAQNLSAADIILFSRRGVRGCCLDYGGATSHVSIMARSLNVPLVVGLHSACASVSTGDHVIVDALHGVVIVNPEEAAIERYSILHDRYLEVVDRQSEVVGLPATTIDGRNIKLRANIELRSEIDSLQSKGAEGVGLFRSEILFLMEGRLSIDEHAQYDVYRTFAESLKPDELTIRVFDLGGDKVLPLAHREHNPFLGWRGLRVLLDKPDLLRPQLRAILRASQSKNIRIMVPMVTTVNEMQDFLTVVDDVKDELSQSGIPFDESVQIGAMIEVPAAAVLADQIGELVDFLSIGTNDLTQYILAVDRGNDLVSGLYDELHPAVLLTISRLVETAKALKKPISICGEMAGNSKNLPVLLGLGITELSASATFLPEMKRMIRAIDHKSAVELANSCLEASGAEEVHMLLDQWLDEHPFDLDHILEG